MEGLIINEKDIDISSSISFLLGTVGCTSKTDTLESENTTSPTTLAENIPKENIDDNNKDLSQSESSQENSNDFEDILPFIPDGWHILEKMTEILQLLKVI